MTVQISCIVEGHGEVAAAPTLIHRIAKNLYPELEIRMPPPIRVSRDKVVKAGELERRVELASRKIGGQGAILILLDSDDDCPAQLGPKLLFRALEVRKDLPIAVVLAKYEFEAWFLAAAESLRGQNGLSKNLQVPNNPGAIRGAKEWLSQQMEGAGTYSPTVDQPALTARFDFNQARRTDSFDKCYRDIVRLLDELRKVNRGDLRRSASFGIIPGQVKTSKYDAQVCRVGSSDWIGSAIEIPCPPFHDLTKSFCTPSCTVEKPLSKNAVIVAGPNGAGKTTFVSEYQPFSGAEYISADAIAAMLVSTPGEFHKIRVRAGRSFLEKIQRLIQSEMNLVIEVTLAGRGFRRIIHQLKNSGYTVVIVFLLLKSPEVCIARVRNRVMAGRT